MRSKCSGKRTLTNLYNARTQWLADAREALDAAVAAAYGWSAGISDEEVRRIAGAQPWAANGRANRAARTMCETIGKGAPNCG